MVVVVKCLGVPLRGKTGLVRDQGRRINHEGCTLCKAWRKDRTCRLHPDYLKDESKERTETRQNKTGKDKEEERKNKIKIKNENGKRKIKRQALDKPQESRSGNADQI